MYDGKPVQQMFYKQTRSYMYVLAVYLFKPDFVCICVHVITDNYVLDTTEIFNLEQFEPLRAKKIVIRAILQWAAVISVLWGHGIKKLPWEGLLSGRLWIPCQCIQTASQAPVQQCDTSGWLKQWQLMAEMC